MTVWREPASTPPEMVEKATSGRPAAMPFTIAFTRSSSPAPACGPVGAAVAAAARTRDGRRRCCRWKLLMLLLPPRGTGAATAAPRARRALVTVVE